MMRKELCIDSVIYFIESSNHNSSGMVSLIYSIIT